MTERPGDRDTLDYDPAEDQDTEPSLNAPTPTAERTDNSSPELHADGNEG